MTRTGASGAPDPAWQAATDACEVLGPEGGLFAGVDPADFGISTLAVLARAAAHPGQVAGAWFRFAAAMGQAWPVAVSRWLGSDAEQTASADRQDRRFADRTWSENPAYNVLLQGYLAAGRLADDLLAAGRGDPLSDQKAELAVHFALDALAPANFLLTNPAALKRAFETGGASVLTGARNFLDDLARNGGSSS